MTDHPHVMRSPIDGRLLYRDVRPQTIAFGGKSVVVELPGYYPVGAGEGVHLAEDMAVSDAAILRIREELAREKAAKKKRVVEPNREPRSVDGTVLPLAPRKRVGAAKVDQSLQITHPSSSRNDGK